MSLRVVFVILSLSAVGLYSGWEMIRFFLVGKLYFNPCVLFVPASVGLALGLPWARSAADGLFKSIYLFCLLIFGFVAVAHRSLFPGQIWGLDGFWVVTVLMLTYLAFLGFLHWQLFTQPFDEWLTRGRREPGDPRDPETPARTRG